MTPVDGPAPANEGRDGSGSAPGDDPTVPLSTLLRTATRAQHARAESMPFVGDLMSGRLDVTAYVAMLAQHHRVYVALEEAEQLVRSDESGRTMVFDGLARVTAIEADLAALVGPSWRGAITVLPATHAYVERLRDVAGSWVGGYVAHAYTRYLGDLSGGLAIKAVLQRSYGLPADCVNFYTFPAIPRPKVFKDL